ncbi:MAG: NYN domain-containing protein, partial [Lachnospiraceae bacterium]|nr:NYN domain-containing protein [Lachnospiraceae bacterium]
EHIGVLTGSPITDMQITLVAGRAHFKHTEGGDFRQATYRAVRQGLCRAQNVLLEPVYAFRLELPASMIGRGMADIQGRYGKFGAPEMAGEYAVLAGTVPVSEMTGYQAEVLAYSGGKGRLYTELKGYAPCHNAEAVISAIGYEAERDTDNPCSSVFCAHGAGFVVEWDQVENYMHLDSAVPDDSMGQGFDDTRQESNTHTRLGGQRDNRVSDVIGQDEIDEIMERTYGRRERKKQGWTKTIRAQTQPPSTSARVQTIQEEYLLVDGYNIIFAWDALSELAKVNLDGARGRLMDILSNYQGYRKMHLILVFDAYKVKGNPGSTVRYHNIDVVYTKEAETADQYIEKVTHEIGRKYRVRVATSDGLEQLIIMGAGAVRVSARELQEEVMAAGEELRQIFLDNPRKSLDGRNYLMEYASDEVASYVEQVRKGD